MPAPLPACAAHRDPAAPCGEVPGLASRRLAPPALLLGGLLACGATGSACLAATPDGPATTRVTRATQPAQPSAADSPIVPHPALLELLGSLPGTDGDWVTALHWALDESHAEVSDERALP